MLAGGGSTPALDAGLEVLEPQLQAVVLREIVGLSTAETAQVLDKRSGSPRAAAVADAPVGASDHSFRVRPREP